MQEYIPQKLANLIYWTSHKEFENSKVEFVVF